VETVGLAILYPELISVYVSGSQTRFASNYFSPEARLAGNFVGPYQSYHRAARFRERGLSD